MGKIFDYLRGSDAAKGIVAACALLGVLGGGYIMESRREARMAAELQKYHEIRNHVSETISRINETYYTGVYPDDCYQILPNDYWTPFSFMDELEFEDSKSGD
jgi:hypothetical protein